MSMHRAQRFDPPRPSVALRDYGSVLRAVFRSAVSCALASSLAGAGCAATATAPEDSDPMGSAGAVATGGGSGGSRAPTPIEAGSGGAGMAGAGVAGTGEPSTTPGAALHCDGTMLQLLLDITPADPFDGAEFRMQFPGSPPQPLGVSGELCSGASDAADCRSAIADAEALLPHDGGCGMIGDCDRYVVATRGDDVSTYANRAQILELLGEIDSPEDVVMLLAYDTYDVLCADPTRLSESGGPSASELRIVDDGFEADVLLTVSTCPYQYAHVTLHIATDGTVSELTRELLPSQSVCAGRRPDGLRSRHLPTSSSALGEHFARMAHLEEASVHAFEVLAQELAHHGAPATLIESALCAAQDEVRHTVLATTLARRFGAASTPVSIAPRPLRSLEAIALDNAEEGCVRECFGAVVGCYQAETSSDAEIAHAMSVIAQDETRHAALAFEIAAWADEQLDTDARARVRSARRRAAAALRVELLSTLDAPTRAMLGLPDYRAASRLHEALERELWAA